LNGHEAVDPRRATPTTDAEHRPSTIDYRPPTIVQ
jgi:hypothetical protein